MKKIPFIATLAVLLFAASCKKHPVAPVTPPQPEPATRLSKLEYDDRHVAATYSADGRLQQMVNTYLPGNNTTAYQFSYTNGKLTGILSGNKWKYLYTNDKITAIETYNEAGELRYRSEYVYSNNRVTEKTDYLIAAAGAFPQFQTFYTYHPDGNVLKKQIFQYVNNGWLYAEDVLYPQYDNQPNYAQPFENHPYLPASVIGGNNPLKEIYTENNVVTLTITNTYTYDNKGRPKTRTSLYQSPPVPDSMATVKMFY